MDSELDAVVVGAGFAGLAVLHLLREQGLSVRGIDAAGDVGGAWWWHDFPGARIDVEAHVHQYFLDETLHRDWGWSERYPGGYEVLRWLRFVADRLDLRRDITLRTRVVGASREDGRWHVRTDRGDVLRARFLIACTGRHAAPAPVLDGEFAGPVVRTADWQEGAHDLTGRRVGVIGSGVCAAQLVPAIAERTAQLTVFADGPLDVLPRRNPVYGWRERDADRDRFAERRAHLPHTVTGADDPTGFAWPAGRAERRACMAELAATGTRALWAATTDEVRDEVTAFVRDAMRERLGDDALAAVLVPRDHAFGHGPVALEQGWLEVFHRPGVDLVDLGASPITRLRPEGVELADGSVHTLDVLVLATDVAAGPPALADLGIDGCPVLGVAVPGRPNLFTAVPPPAGPIAAATVQSLQVEWIARLIATLGREEVAEPAEPPATDDARPDRGGVGAYARRLADEEAAGHPSLRRHGDPCH